MVLGTWATRMAPLLRFHTWLAENAVSSPPIETSAVTPSCRNVSSTFAMSASHLAGLVQRGAEHRSAVEMQSADIGDGELADVRVLALNEPLVAVVAADHFEAVVDRFDRDRTDDAIDSRRGPPPTRIATLPPGFVAFISVSHHAADPHKIILAVILSS